MGPLDSTVQFVFVDHEEWLTPSKVVRQLIGPEIRAALTESVVVEFEGALFCHQSVNDPEFATSGYGAGETISLIETRPTPFSRLTPPKDDARDSTVCPQCSGSGTVTERSGPTTEYTSTCENCNGDGVQPECERDSTAGAGVAYRWRPIGASDDVWSCGTNHPKVTDGWAIEPLYTAASLASAHADGIREGLGQAAKVLNKRHDALFDENGGYEPDTNVTNLPEWVENVVGELQELHAAIRVLINKDAGGM